MSLFDSLRRARDKLEAKIEAKLQEQRTRPTSTPQPQYGGGGGGGGGRPGWRPSPAPPGPPSIPHGTRPSCAPPALPPRQQDSGRQYINAVYFPSWKVYENQTPASLDVNNITHVFYAFVGVHEDGTLRHCDDWLNLNKDVDGEKGCLAALAKLKQSNPRIKTVLSVGGGVDSKEFPALAASEDARARFANQAREFCDLHNLDGIDIDWEHPHDSRQGYDFLQLLQACRQTLPAQSYLLTTALPVGEYVLKHIDLRAVSNLVDYLNLMAYDYTGSWTQTCGHQAQLYKPAGPSTPESSTCTSSGVDYILSRGFPSQKLLLGIPVYARNFPGAQGPGQKFEGAGEMDYGEMPDEWVERAHVDAGAAAAWYVDYEGRRGFVSFDVPETVRIKARYATARDLGGLFYWTGTGDKKDHLSLVAAGGHMLGSR